FPAVVEQVHAHVGIELDRVGAPDDVIRRHGELRHLDAPVQWYLQKIASDGVEQQDTDHEEYGVHGKAAELRRYVVDRPDVGDDVTGHLLVRSEEHTSELQS